jgi:hypothetical protein
MNITISSEVAVPSGEGVDEFHRPVRFDEGNLIQAVEAFELVEAVDRLKGDASI